MQPFTVASSKSDSKSKTVWGISWNLFIPLWGIETHSYVYGEYKKSTMNTR